MIETYDAATTRNVACCPTGRSISLMDLSTFLEDQARMVSLVANHLIMHSTHDECIKRMRIVDHLIAVEHDLKEAAFRTKKETWTV